VWCRHRRGFSVSGRRLIDARVGDDCGGCRGVRTGTKGASAVVITGARDGEDGGLAMVRMLCLGGEEEGGGGKTRQGW